MSLLNNEYIVHGTIYHKLGEQCHDMILLVIAHGRVLGLVGLVLLNVLLVFHVLVH